MFEELTLSEMLDSCIAEIYDYLDTLPPGGGDYEDNQT